MLPFQGMDEPLIQIKKAYKRFGHVEALRGADLCVFPGEITALVGDNGSGKSTLVKLLNGAYRPDAGRIIIRGKSFSYLTPRSAIAEGIATVHQDLALDDRRDCAGNVFLGRERVKLGFWIDRRGMLRETQRLLLELNVAIPDITLPVGLLSGGQRQGVAVARAVHQQGEVLIFDEPTAAMDLRESRQVMELIRNLKARGKTVIMISHNLFQVFDVADRICVIKGGRCVASCPTAQSTPEEINRIILTADPEVQQG